MKDRQREHETEIKNIFNSYIIVLIIAIIDSFSKPK